MFAKMVSVFGRFFRRTDLRDSHRPSITTAASPVNSSGPIKTARDKSLANSFRTAEMVTLR
jgi:hypothetical protein